MQSNKIDAGTFSKMFLAGAKRLESKKEIINELNVFPVPDGDTGTNMSLTVMAAVTEVEKLDADTNMQVVSKSISSGSLRGARGNSGVILSQLFRGFTKVVRDEEEIDIELFTKAMQKAVETAYKAVMKPKEGTILTVARGAAEHAAKIAAEMDDFDSYFKSIIDEAERVLQQTPEMLPVLKEAGVVDSGGQGLLEIFKGGYAYYSGEDVDVLFASNDTAEDVVQVNKVVGYSASFVINRTNDKSIDAYSMFLDSIASNICVAEDNGIVNVSVFTEDPGRVLSKALSYGSVDEVKINPETSKPEATDVKAVNIRVVSSDEPATDSAEVHDETPVTENTVAEVTEDTEETVTEQEPVEEPAPQKAEPSKEMGFIAVSVGEGLNEIFRGLGVDGIITGGQTMNPSTDDLIKAIDEVDAKTVFVLPNNKNIIMAANQAQYLVEDKNVIVIPTTTIPQGITALINYMSDCSVEDNEAAMKDAIANVKTGQVTFAVRDTVINGLEIHQGNIMGIGDHDILSVGTVVEETAMQMIGKMTDEDTELICIYYGDEVDEEIANEFARSVEEAYPDCDVEIHPGGQPIYYYIISAE